MSGVSDDVRHQLAEEIMMNQPGIKANDCQADASRSVRGQEMTEEEDMSIRSDNRGSKEQPLIEEATSKGTSAAVTPTEGIEEVQANQRTIELRPTTHLLPSPTTPRVPIWMRSTPAIKRVARPDVNTNVSSPTLSSSSSSPSLTVAPSRTQHGRSSAPRTTLARAPSAAAIKPTSSRIVIRPSTAARSSSQLTVSSSSSSSSTRPKSASSHSQRSATQTSNRMKHSSATPLLTTVVTAATASNSVASLPHLPLPRPPPRAYLKRTSLASSFFTPSLDAGSRECDRDSLSLIFSYLLHVDFCASLRVSHYWLKVAQLQNAWPKVNMETLIRSRGDSHGPSREIRIKYNVPLPQSKVSKGTSKSVITTSTASSSSSPSSSALTSSSASTPSTPDRRSALSRFSSSQIFTRASCVTLQIASKGQMNSAQIESLHQVLSGFYETVAPHLLSFKLSFHSLRCIDDQGLIRQLTEFLCSSKLKCLAMIELPRLFHPMTDFTYVFESISKISSLRVLRIVDDISAEVISQFTQLVSLSLLLESRSLYSTQRYPSISPGLVVDRWRRLMKTVEAVRRLSNEHQLRILELDLDDNPGMIDCLYKHNISAGTVSGSCGPVSPDYPASVISSPPASLDTLHLRIRGNVNLDELLVGIPTLTELSIHSNETNLISIPFPSNLKRFDTDSHNFHSLLPSSSHLLSCRFYLTHQNYRYRCLIPHERFDRWIRGMTGVTELELGELWLCDGSSFDAMSVCTQLKKLTLRPIHQPYLVSLLRVISRLPNFTVLHLTILPPEIASRSGRSFDSKDSPQQFVLTDALLLQTIATSVSWRILHVHLSSSQASPIEIVNARKPLWTPNLNYQPISIAQLLQSHPVASHHLMTRRIDSFRLYHTSDLRDTDQIYALDSHGTKRESGALIWKVV